MQNLKAGTVDEVSLDINMDLPSGEDGTLELKKLELKKLDGAIAYSDLSVFYFRPMPPATGVMLWSGKALIMKPQLNI